MSSSGARFTQTPSKALHLRNLPWECAEEELVELCKPFGKIVNTKCNVGADRNQAFVEFTDFNQAISMVSYYASSSEPAQVRGKTVYIQYSNRHEIVNDKSTGNAPGNALLVTTEGVEAVDVSIDVIHLCQIIKCSSISDLPDTVLDEIFLKLRSLKSIFRCKSVCKTWRCRISSGEFAKAHLVQAKEFITLIRDVHHSKSSSRFHLLEDKTWNDGDEELSIEFDSKNTVDHRSEVVRSCNGLLCLFKLGYFFEQDVTRDSIVVCNPITGEFTYLPNSTCNASLRAVEFGFSPKHNEYKVIRVLRKWIDNDPKLEHYDVAEIHTLGTGSWMKLDSWPTAHRFLDSPAYLDGAFHWLLRQNNDNGGILSLDLNDEKFQVNSVPFKVHSYSALKVQEGCLYMLNTSHRSHDIWVMKKNGNPMDWTKYFSISRRQLYSIKNFKLVSCVNNESAVFFHCLRGIFIIYERSKGMRSIQPKFPSRRSSFEVLAYTPSFFSLKDIVRPENVDVLNIKYMVWKVSSQT